MPDVVAESAFKKWCECMAAPELSHVMKESIAAAINAWPDMLDADRISFDGSVQRFISLPVKAEIIPLRSIK